MGGRIDSWSMLKDHQRTKMQILIPYNYASVVIMLPNLYL